MQWFGMFTKFVGIHSFTVSVIKIYAMEQKSKEEQNWTDFQL